MACRNGFSEMALTVSTFPGFLSFYRLCTDVPPPLNPPQKKSGRESLSLRFFWGEGGVCTQATVLFVPEKTLGTKETLKREAGVNRARGMTSSSPPPPLSLAGVPKFPFYESLPCSSGLYVYSCKQRYSLSFALKVVVRHPINQRWF